MCLRHDVFVRSSADQARGKNIVLEKTCHFSRADLTRESGSPFFFLSFAPPKNPPISSRLGQETHVTPYISSTPSDIKTVWGLVRRFFFSRNTWALVSRIPRYLGNFVVVRESPHESSKMFFVISGVHPRCEKSKFSLLG